LSIEVKRLVDEEDVPAQGYICEQQDPLAVLSKVKIPL
jgi:hypothetical protein